MMPALCSANPSTTPTIRSQQRRAESDSSATIPVDEPEHRILGELDERLEHRRLAGKVAVERRFRYAHHPRRGARW